MSEAVAEGGGAAGVDEARPTRRGFLPAGIDRRVFEAMWLLAFVSTLGYAGRWHWTLDLLAHPRRFLFVCAAVGLAWLAIRRRWWFGSAALAALVLNGAPMASLYLGGHAPAVDGATPLRLVVFNVLTDNPRKGDVLAYLADGEADLIGLLETDDRWVAALRELEGYRLVTAQARSDNFGLVLLERDRPRPGVSSAMARVVYANNTPWALPMIEAELTLDDRPVTVLLTHPIPPIGWARATDNREQLAWCAEWAEGRAERGVGAVVAGDFNATPFGSAFAPFSRAGLVNSQRGYGWSATWPGELTPLGLGIPIDHVVHSADLATVDRDVGPKLGSDHHAVVVDLAWAR
ncbi:MAG: endonuclease/exonuclease/phosphatase family protein [Planctomycetota bacterium]